MAKNSGDLRAGSNLVSGPLRIPIPMDSNGNPNLKLMMQSLKLDGNGATSVEPKFYHYCYVCNTQLNSCKQALLHCSGKRHRKKLQFLQSRKHPIGQLPGGAPIGAPPAAPCSTGPGDPSSCYSQQIYPSVSQHSLPNLPRNNAPSQFTHQEYLPISAAGSVGTSLPPTCPPFYPAHASVLSPATMAGTDQWLHSVPMYHHTGPVSNATPMQMSQQVAPSHPGAGYPAVGMSAGHGPLPIQMGQRYPQAILPAQNYCGARPSNSPLLLTDISGSSYSGGRTSAVISPSDSGSLSSDLSNRGRSFKCHVCQRHFGSLPQLHCHLQAARHYKNDCQQFYNGADFSTGAVIVNKAVDSSETDSTSSVYYCSACNVAVNSQVQMDNHNAGLKHKQRVGAQQRKHSRSSSTSSEPPGEREIVVDSGYASGSGDDTIVLLNPTPERPAARFRCQICNTYMNSSVQTQQHLASQKHQLRLGGKPPFKRKSNSFKKKVQQTLSGASNVAPSQELSASVNPSSSQEEIPVITDPAPEGECVTPETSSPEPETDSTLTVTATTSLTEES